MAKIDPTARVADGARLAADVEIGPFCTVGPDVEIGEGSKLLSHVNVQGHTKIGARATIYPFASLGTPPQSVHFKGEPSRLVVGSDCVIRESVTMNIGTAGGHMETVVGDRCMFMAYSHVGHDCTVGNNVIFANGGTLGGHCSVGDFVFVGGFAAVHQFTRIGERCIIGGLSGVEHDVIPFAATIGSRAKLGGLNIIGLKRGGFTRPQIHALRHAYRALFSGGIVLDNAEKVAAEFKDDANVQKMVQFVRDAGKRRLTVPRDMASGEGDD